MRAHGGPWRSRRHLYSVLTGTPRYSATSSVHHNGLGPGVACMRAIAFSNPPRRASCGREPMTGQRTGRGTMSRQRDSDACALARSGILGDTAWHRSTRSPSFGEGFTDRGLPLTHLRLHGSPTNFAAISPLTFHASRRLSITCGPLGHGLGLRHSAHKAAYSGIADVNDPLAEP